MKVKVTRAIIAGGKHAEKDSVVDLPDAEASYLIAVGSAVPEDQKDEKPLTKEEKLERAEHPTYKEIEAKWLKPAEEREVDPEHPTYKEIENELSGSKSEKAVMPESEAKDVDRVLTRHVEREKEKAHEQDKRKRDK